MTTSYMLYRAGTSDELFLNTASFNCRDLRHTLALYAVSARIASQNAPSVVDGSIQLRGEVGQQKHVVVQLELVIVHE